MRCSKSRDLKYVLLHNCWGKQNQEDRSVHLAKFFPFFSLSFFYAFKKTIGKLLVVSNSDVKGLQWYKDDELIFLRERLTLIALVQLRIFVASANIYLFWRSKSERRADDRDPFRHRLKLLFSKFVFKFRLKQFWALTLAHHTEVVNFGCVWLQLSPATRNFSRNRTWSTISRGRINNLL